MNLFDSTIISFLNQLANKSMQFDKLVLLISDNMLLKGGVIAALLWWAWFEKGHLNQMRKNRERILATIFASSLAILGARLLTRLFPFRPRPLHNSEIMLQFPVSEELEAAFREEWSSFPSDHAILFFTLATCLFFISRFLGTIAIIHAIFVVCLPRIYLGLHYPTDIIAGALIGIGVAFWANKKTFRKYIARIPMQWLEKNPSLFYASFSLVIYQIAEMFTSSRNILKELFLLFSDIA